MIAPIQHAKPTPGKLRVGQPERAGIYDSTGFLVASCFNGVNCDKPNVANAERLAHCWNMFDELVAACESAQCECTPRERMSGHQAGCWFPAMQDVIARATGKETK